MTKTAENDQELIREAAVAIPRKKNRGVKALKALLCKSSELEDRANAASGYYEELKESAESVSESMRALRGLKNDFGELFVLDAGSVKYSSFAEGVSAFLDELTTHSTEMTFTDDQGEEVDVADELRDAEEELSTVFAEFGMYELAPALERAEKVIEALEEGQSKLRWTVLNLKKNRKAREAYANAAAEAREYFGRLGADAKSIWPSRLRISDNLRAHLTMLASRGVLGTVKPKGAKAPRYYLV